jgi:hypothetical protein
MMRHMDLPVSEGSEDNITPPGEWKSKHTWTSSEESIPKRPSPPPHGKGHIEEEEEEEEEEEDEGEEGDGKEDDKEEGDEDDDDDDDELSPWTLACFFSLFGVLMPKGEKLIY